MACDQVSGAATGPQRASHSGRYAGYRTARLACSGNAPSASRCASIQAAPTRARSSSPGPARCRQAIAHEAVSTGHCPPP